MAPVKKRARRDLAAVTDKEQENEVEAETNQNESNPTPTSMSGVSVPSLPDLQRIMKRVLDQIRSLIRGCSSIS